MNKHTIVLWTDEMVYVRGAIESSIDRFSKRWRTMFIEGDGDIAAVYLPAIRALQNALVTMDQVLPPRR